jgi:hypothetical protein
MLFNCNETCPVKLAPEVLLLTHTPRVLPETIETTALPTVFFVTVAPVIAAGFQLPVVVLPEISM